MEVSQEREELEDILMMYGLDSLHRVKFIILPLLPGQWMQTCGALLQLRKKQNLSCLLTYGSGCYPSCLSLDYILWPDWSCSLSLLIKLDDSCFCWSSKYVFQRVLSQHSWEILSADRWQAKVCASCFLYYYKWRRKKRKRKQQI